ncbi:serine protease [Patescibacteria group bacterium]|nr:serine protease [Patescibacteria group bacterium]
MRKLSRIIIIILSVFLFVSGMVIAGFILYGQGVFDKPDKVFNIKRPEVVNDNKDTQDTQDRIKQLEDKIIQLEEDRKIPFPEPKITFLTQDQIKAVVELWCPDDDYGYGSDFISIGSGTVISSEGLIITNRHVISNEDWSVITASPTCYVAITNDISEEPVIKYTAELIAYSPENSSDFDFDVAILYISGVCEECENAPRFIPSEFSYLEPGYSDGLNLGDYIAIAGYPTIGAGTFNFTEGIVSGRVGGFVIKTDAKIDSGNSGGSALNNKYELIGVPTWTISGGAESMGYIIGIDQVFNWYNNKVMASKSKEVAY